jgi:hypothetical protein
VSAAAALGVARAEISRHVVVAVGEAVAEGQVVARSRSLFGLLTAEVRSPVGGVLESISEATGQLLIRAAPRPIELPAYVTGTVVEVAPGAAVTVEAEVALAQGIFGIGGEAFGELIRVCREPDQILDENRVSSDHRGAVLLGGGRVTLSALRRMREIGARAVVTGSASGADLIELVGGGLNPAATGDEDLGLTVVLSEGFGELAMAGGTFELLSALEGRPVSASGATQVRAGVIRPEVVGPALDARPDTAPAGEVAGQLVRIVRGARFGAVGRVVAAPDEPVQIDNGALASVYEVELEDGETAVVPRANVEHLGG